MLPSVDIASCEVFNIKVNNIEHETEADNRHEVEPKYSPVTDAATAQHKSLILAFISWTLLFI